MLINKIEDLKKASFESKPNFEVIGEAFDFCQQVLQAQVSGSGTDWSIAATGGWLALVTGLNHKIHRIFMSKEKKDQEDLRHIIFKDYIIKKTTVNNKYELVLRN